MAKPTVMNKELIKRKLIAWCKKHKYSQGDDYYVGIRTHPSETCNMTDGYSWYVGYENDYPMQHGKGKKYILTQEEFNQAIQEEQP